MTLSSTITVANLRHAPLVRLILLLLMVWHSRENRKKSHMCPCYLRDHHSRTLRPYHQDLQCLGILVGNFRHLARSRRTRVASFVGPSTIWRYDQRMSVFFLTLFFFRPSRHSTGSPPLHHNDHWILVSVMLASCSFDGGVLIHREVRPRNWEILYAGRQLHESSVNSVAFCPPEFGLMVAAASSDGRVSILAHQPDNSWSISYIQDNALGVNSVSWAPAGAYHDESSTNPEAVTAGSSPDGADLPRLVTGGCDNSIRFWVQEPSTGQWVEDTSCPVSGDLGHGDWVRDVAWAPAIMPNVNMVASCSEDRTVLIWTQRGQGQPWEAMLLHTFDAPVWRVSWSLTGHILAVSSGDSDVALWKKGMDGQWYQMESVQDEAASAQEG
jgi:protein transport protein SEC13